MSEDIKQYIIIRKDLNMRKGKMCSQAAHASMAAVLNAAYFVQGVNEDNTVYSQYEFNQNSYVTKWLEGTFTKIVLGVDSEKELLDLFRKVLSVNNKNKDYIPVSLIKDSGLTEFNGIATYTSLAIGPWLTEDLKQFTENLKLL